jgi:excisionase family DNA binding protein
MPWFVSPNLCQGIAPLLEGRLMNTFIQNQVKGGNTEMPTPPMLYTVKQAAYLLGIKTTTMYAQINKGMIRVCRVGADMRVSHQAIVDFIASAEEGFNFDE